MNKSQSVSPSSVPTTPTPNTLNKNIFQYPPFETNKAIDLKVNNQQQKKISPNALIETQNKNIFINLTNHFLNESINTANNLSPFSPGPIRKFKKNSSDPKIKHRSKSESNLNDLNLDDFSLTSPFKNDKKITKSEMRDNNIISDTKKFSYNESITCDQNTFTESNKFTKIKKIILIYKIF